MESKKVKTNRYLAYLEAKRDDFVKKLVRVGAKMVNMNDEDYDLEAFIKSFVPSSNSLKKKIIDEARESRLSLVTEPSIKEESIDSVLFEALRVQIKEFEKDFKELRIITEPENANDDEKVPAEDEPKPQQQEKQKPHKKTPDDGEIAAESHYLSQVINPGEMSKIFVQKSRVDVVRSMIDNPNFDEDNLETIYIYRSKKC